jgi:Skp family chaperone for outer membrane proteins
MHVSKIGALFGAMGLAAVVALAAQPVMAQDKAAPAVPVTPAAPAAPAANASGSTLRAPVIAVVDVQRIMQESEAAKGISQSFNDLRESYQKEISALEDKLRKSEEELRKQQTVLAPDALVAKRRDFEKQVADVQKVVQNRKRGLDVSLNEAMGVVQKTMLDVVAEVAGERGANLVLARHQFVLIDTALDVTGTVLERVNKKLPKVALNIPKAEDAPKDPPKATPPKK